MFKPNFRYTNKIVNNLIQISVARELFKISDRAALKEIRKLMDLEVIKTEGKGRSLSYILA
ncbi:MAG: hypothetical protein H8E13_03610 [Actinobacteria bacterium]|nr:hypothetical protein [Actinomycetota bacterium]